MNSTSALSRSNPEPGCSASSPRISTHSSRTTSTTLLEQVDVTPELLLVGFEEATQAAIDSALLVDGQPLGRAVDQVVNRKGVGGDDAFQDQAEQGKQQ